MSTHESIVRDEDIQPGSDRSFGLIVGGVLSAIGAYQLLNDMSSFIWFLTPGVLLMALGLVAPKLLRPLNLLWTKLGLLLGRVVTPVVMFLVYAISVVPIGLILRATGKDLLSLKRRTGEGTYWVARTPPGPAPESLRDQF